LAYDSPKPKKEYKLKIGDVMAAVDRNDGSWLSKQKEDDREGFVPYTFIRWVSSIENVSRAEDVIGATNYYLNPYMLTYSEEHPELAFRLGALCGTGKREKHIWVPPAKRPIVNNKARDLVAQYNPLANDDEIDMLLRLYTRDSFKEFINDAGLVDAEAKETLAAYDKLFPKT
jgi:hypothetical protein